MTKSTIDDRNKTIAGFEVGDLVQIIKTGEVVMVTYGRGNEGTSLFHGTVVATNKSPSYFLGYHSDGFDKQYFKPFCGSVKLDTE